MTVKTTKNTLQFRDLKKANFKAELYKSAIYFMDNTNENLCHVLKFYLLKLRQHILTTN